MPLQTNDTKLTEITVDASGHEQNAPELASYDPSGKMVTNEQLAELNKPPVAEPTKEEVTQQEEGKKSEAEARKLFLQAQKAERKAKEMEKKAAESLKKAEAFDQAVELASSGKDPTALLKAAGLDPVDFYRKMTTYALNKPEETPEDPVQKEIRLLKEQNAKYAKDLEVEIQNRQQERDLQEHNRIISEKVIPLITQNVDKYEALLNQFGQNTAVTVYNEVMEHFIKTGEMIPFEQAADVLEKYWSDTIESGINVASKMKKFAARFAQQAQTPQTQTIEPEETPRRSNFTLSNKQTISAPPASTEAYNRYVNRDERAAQILKKFGG